jgi:RimJ/RimL family protein N-acetyltransferase
VSLRPWRSAEAPALVSICADEEVAHRTPFPTPFPLDLAQRIVEGRSGYLDLAVVGGDDFPVGLVSLNLSTRSASYVVGAHARGRGFATRALTRLWSIAVVDLGLDKLVLEIEPGNSASASVAQRCGFRPTGSSEWVEDKGREYELVVWERCR